MTQAYHFVGKTLRDGSPIPANGVTLYHTGKLKMCASGFHGSRKVWQALEYAPGATICFDEYDGDILHGTDKLVATERTIIARINGEALLYKYARLCALDVIHLWDAPDVVVEFLTTGNEELRTAARDAAALAAPVAAGAAWAAACAAARNAALAARDAARDAALAAAWAASWRASWRASGDAALAARDASEKKQRQRLTKMVNAEFAK